MNLLPSSDRNAVVVVPFDSLKVVETAHRSFDG
jgi:hypothetical protein